ncbi:hypothetical protein AAMO2058_001673000 [Amorphochlora amoebiformis]
MERQEGDEIVVESEHGLVLNFARAIDNHYTAFRLNMHAPENAFSLRAPYFSTNPRLHRNLNRKRKRTRDINQKDDIHNNHHHNLNTNLNTNRNPKRKQNPLEPPNPPSTLEQPAPQRAPLPQVHPRPHKKPKTTKPNNTDTPLKRPKPRSYMEYDVPWMIKAFRDLLRLYHGKGYPLLAPQSPPGAVGTPSERKAAVRTSLARWGFRSTRGQALVKLITHYMHDVLHVRTIVTAAVTAASTAAAATTDNTCTKDNTCSIDHSDPATWDHTLPGAPQGVRSIRRGAVDVEEIHSLYGQRYVIPAGARYLNCDIRGLRPLLLQKPKTNFDLIVLDPPWPSMSVQRSAAYKTLNTHDLVNLPVRKLLRQGGWVMVWVTNNPDIHRLVRHKMFPKWRCTFYGTWYWLKVTDKMETVLPLTTTPSHTLARRPYEPVILGRRTITDSSLQKKSLDHKRCGPNLSSSTTRGPATGHGAAPAYTPSAAAPCVPTVPPVKPAQFEPARCAPARPLVPKKWLFCAVPPPGRHSNKPPIGRLFCQRHLGSSYHDDHLHPQCLELFARNLLPTWWSWGNQALKFQQLQLFLPNRDPALRPGSLDTIRNPARDTDRASDGATDLDRDRDRDRDGGTDRDRDRNRDLDRGTDEGTDRCKDRGTDRGTDQGTDRGTDRDSE